MTRNSLRANYAPMQNRSISADVFKAGWNDYVSGLPPCREYADADDEHIARTYEMGRCEAAAARAAGRVPRMRANWHPNAVLKRTAGAALALDEMYHHTGRLSSAY